MTTAKAAYYAFLDDCSLTLSNASLRYYRTFCEYFLATVDADGAAQSALTECNYNKYLLHLRRRVSDGDLTAASANSYLRAVRRFYNFCEERKLIRGTFKMRMLKQQSAAKGTLSDDDVNTILQHVNIDTQMSIVALILLSTAARSRSVRLLRMCDIDFAENAITFVKTKNQKPLRLPLSEEVTAVLSAFCLANNRKHDDYLFQNQAGNAYDGAGLYHRMQQYLHSIGVNKQGIHIFRRTAARQFVVRGMEAFTLQAWLGHSTITQSAHYVTLYSDDLRRSFHKYNYINLTTHNNTTV